MKNSKNRTERIDNYFSVTNEECERTKHDWVPVQELPAKLMEHLDRLKQMGVLRSDYNSTDIIIAAKRHIYLDGPFHSMKTASDIGKPLYKIFVFSKELVISEVEPPSAYGTSYIDNEDSIQGRVQFLVSRYGQTLDRILSVHSQRHSEFGKFIVEGNPEDGIPEDLKKCLCKVE